MASQRNKKCPKCGKKNKICRCFKNQRKIIYIPTLLAIIFLCCCGLLWDLRRHPTYTPEELVKNAQKRFERALESLPNKNVQAHLIALMQKKDFVRYGFYLYPNAAMYNKDDDFLFINANSSSWLDLNIENLWCLLVHENQHILQREKAELQTTEQEESFSLDQEAKISWDKEIEAIYAEASFAQNFNLLEYTHPDISNKLTLENMDLKTAILVTTFPRIIRDEARSRYWPYFPEIYNSQLPPQYREKYGVKTN